MQTQIVRDSKPVQIGAMITIGSLPQEPPKNWIRQSRIGSARPPYVKPVRFPDEIISDILTYEDREMLIRTIISKQKNHSDWDIVRAKLPEDFLNKLKQLLKECWENGFCAPYVMNSELKWKQILGNARNSKDAEQCDLCRNSFTGGTCKGRSIYSPNKQRIFKKCWER